MIYFLKNELIRLKQITNPSDNDLSKISIYQELINMPKEEIHTYSELKRFRKDRGLDLNSFDMETFLRKVYEEIFELMGFPDDFCKYTAKKRARLEMEYMEQYDEDYRGTKRQRFTNNTVKVDALCDIQVYCDEANDQLGYHNELAMLEVCKEINSREGEIVNGKFEKFKTPEAIAKWYKADFTKAMKL